MSKIRSQNPLRTTQVPNEPVSTKGTENNEQVSTTSTLQAQLQTDRFGRSSATATKQNQDGLNHLRQTSTGRFQAAPRTNAAQLLRQQGLATKSTVDAQLNPPASETTKGAADRLYKAMKGLGTNEKEIMRVLSDRSSEEIALIRKDFKAKTGGESLDSWLKSELGGNDLKKAELLMEGSKANPAKRDSEMLRMAMEGVGTDEKAVLDTLYGKTDFERQQIASEYKKTTGRDLRTDILKEHGGGDETLAMAVLERGRITDADKLRSAMRGVGTDEKGVFRTLENKTPEQLSQIKADYKRFYGRDLAHDIRSEMSSEQEVKALALLDKGKFSDADKLKSAMAGIGTDEKAIREVFTGKTPEERKAIVSEFEKNYGPLDKALNSELSSREMDEVKTLMNTGDMSAAQKLNRAMRGFGTDEAAIMETLDGLSPEKLAATKTEYKQKFGEDLETHLKNELSGKTLEKAELLAKNGKLTLSERIHYATDGLGTDEAALFKALEKATPQERASLEKDYRAKFGGGAWDKISSELSGRDEHKAKLLLQNGKLSTADKLQVAMQGVGTREEDVFKALEGATPQERQELKDNPAFLKQMRSELSGAALERANLLLENGKLSREEQLHYAMRGAGTDEEAVHKALEGLSTQERTDLQQSYKARYGRDLKAQLESELGKRDMWKASDALEMPPKNIRERLERAEIRASRERHNGSAVSNVSDGVMDAFSSTGQSIDQELREFKLLVQDTREGKVNMLEADKQLSAAETRLNKLTDEYRTEKEAVADTVGNIATVSVAAAATAATGGLAAPAAAALVAATAGATKVATKQLIAGNSYELLGADGAKDFLTGAGEGLAFVAGGKAADALTSAVGKRVLMAQGKNVTEKGLMLMGRQALRESGGKVTMASVQRAADGVLKKAGSEFLEQTLLRKVASGSIIGATRGVVQSSITSVTGNLANEELYKQEFGDAVKKVLGDAGTSAANSAKGWALGTAAFKVGDHMSQAIMKKLSHQIGSKLAAGQQFSDQKIMSAAYEAVGAEAKNMSREAMMNVGRHKLLVDMGEHYFASTARGQAMKFATENLLTRGIAAQPRTLLNNLGDHSVWEDGYVNALGNMWGESSLATMNDMTKLSSKEAAVRLARRMRTVKQGSAAESLLSNLVIRGVGAGIQ